jgi:pantoate--beta-alanine ligase
VVSKLFNIVQPDRAFFGAKDFQQAAIIRRMTADLDFPVEIVVCPTIREADGLAMSSRNRRLTAEHRRQAPALYRALQAAAGMIREDAETRRLGRLGDHGRGDAETGRGKEMETPRRPDAKEPRADAVVAAARAAINKDAPDGRIDYIEIVNPRFLSPVEIARPPVLVALAVKFGDVRLIDNVLVE